MEGYLQCERRAAIAGSLLLWREWAAVGDLRFGADESAPLCELCDRDGCASVLWREARGHASGSSMVVSSSSQDRLGSVGSYYPYGEDKGGALPNDQLKFATYTRDSATGLDYAMNRYFSSAWGRFGSPDPYKGSAGPSDPQSWNRYAFVSGDPINRSDKRGLCSGEALLNDGGLGELTSTCDDESVGGSGPCGPGLQFDSTISACIAVDVLIVQAGGTPPGSSSFLPKDDARKDLGKTNCWKLLGFASAEVAQKWFEQRITFYYHAAGLLKVQGGQLAPDTPAPASASGYGQVNINTNYNWADFSKNPTAGGGIFNYLAYENQLFGTNMNSEQLGALIVIHELEHNLPIGNDESVGAQQKIINNCIK